MKLPFPIRGTPEWDAREYERYLDNPDTCLSFGPIPQESHGWRVLERKINEHVTRFEQLNNVNS